MNGTFHVITSPVALSAASLSLLLLPSCARVTVDPIEVKPIHIVHEINIRVDRQLDDFFAYQEKMAASSQPSTTQAAPAQTARANSPSGVKP